MISIKNLSVYYKLEKNYVVALDDISMDIHDGEFLVLVGPSGGGKTTLLKAILGLLDHIEGDIIIDDISVLDMALKDRNFAYISQSYSLYSKMTIYENLAFPLKMMKIPYEEIHQRVLDISKKLDIEILLTRKPKHLSGGQQQLVAIARALIKKPRLMLFDEPFSNIDISQRAYLRMLIKKLHLEERPTFVYATHDKVEALSLADRIIVINGGEIEQEGTPDTLIKHPKTPFLKEFAKK